MKRFCTEHFYNKLACTRLWNCAYRKHFSPRKPRFGDDHSHCHRRRRHKRTTVKSQFVPKRRVHVIIRDYLYRYTDVLLKHYNVLYTVFSRLPLLFYRPRRLIHVATIDLYSVKTRKIAQWPYCKFDLAMQIVTYKHIYTVYRHYTYIVIIYIIESRGKSFIIEGIAVV